MIKSRNRVKTSQTPRKHDRNGNPADSPQTHSQPGPGFPAAHPDVDFYTIHAGAHDEVHCSRPAEQTAACSRGAMFEAAPNVRAQLNVGTGATAGQVDLDLTDGSLYTARGGDLDGVGHFKAKNNTGEITLEMLTSDCTGTACRGTYDGGPVTTD